MRPALLPYATREVPRYTSYPTAAQFGDGVDEALYRSWLAALPAGAPLSLYVHVPWCEKLCWYCGCHTNVANDAARVARYAGLLGTEAELLAAALPDRHGPIAHLHFGGGTPTLLAPSDFAGLVAGIGRRFGFARGAEIAVEADPRTLAPAMVAAMAEAGVNRVSLGVQDFDPRVQRAINRVQPFDLVAAACDRLRAAGMGALNFDLIYGLPLQTVESVRETARLAISLAPDRLAVFGYAHVPWFKAHQKMIADSDLPGPAERMAQADAIEEELAAAGYLAVGLDHFARPGDELARAIADGRLKRNFQGYTTDDAPILLGLGASSIGALPQGYVQNARETGEWSRRVGEGRLAAARGLATDSDDRMRRAIIEAIMCFGEADAGTIARAHGFAASDLGPSFEALRPLVGDGLCVIEGTRVTVRADARRFVRHVAAAFDAWAIRPAEARRRHSVAI